MKRNIKMFRYGFVITVVLVTTVIFLLLYAKEPYQGEDLYLEYCATCHGDNMEGGNAKSLVDGIWQFGSTREQIIRNIKEGIPQRGMPDYGSELSDQQIEQIYAFLKEEEGEPRSRVTAEEEMVQTLNYDLRLETWLDNLDFPWGIAFIDKKQTLFTERPGNLRMVINGRLQPEAIKGTPRVLDSGQGGLMDVAVDPEYDKNGWIYLSYSHDLKDVAGADGDLAMTRLVRGKVRDNTWVNQQVIYEADHKFYSDRRHHYGSRIVFDKQGYLYFSIGDRGDRRQAQDTSRPNGKIHRIHRDGTTPDDNPFVGRADALPTIFTYGNRNPQGLAMHPETDQVWEAEHGPMGGDEINLLSSGTNYGWPVVTYGLNYNGTIISNFTKKPDMESPILYWRPSIAVCSIDFYNGDLFPRWKNDLIVAALKYEEVRILDIENNRVLHDEVILKDYGRVRDVGAGPDGAIYVVLNEPDKILRLTPISD
jgi:glucose/arabinose dehydrogenase